MNQNFANLRAAQPADCQPAGGRFHFVSQDLPGATMNRYGVVFFDGSQASPAVRGMIQREAQAAGCRQVADPDRDIGLVWIAPNP